MATDPERLAMNAYAAHEGGDSREAKRLFQRILDEHPDAPRAHDARAYLAGNQPPARPAAQHAAAETVQLVRVIDVDIRFVTMVGLFVKAAFAAIPAAIIVALIYGVLLIALRGAIR